ncbi:Flp family type IVb pilin [Allobranchiibius sp. GilTou73]|uniref:Flp family type IVb pilin n=1 Tax=Allobranchiibius sp. GilTou73 TaxID=2904523 RepID=UPI001F245CAF|nr:Flp family type IVb pilin [Allobranchiibius sp. GilTou73]UIJ34301.1 Flp family type IVb pilin [Allobranchiibius sp. GilTou73]
MSAVAAYFFTTLVGLQDRLQTRKERGATAVESGLLVGLIAVAIITVVGTLGTNLSGLFTNISDKIGAANK